jgi:4-aminobutyrate aminotransferase-like enzyme
LAEPAFLEQVAANGAELGEMLQSITRRTERVRAVRGLGYMWGIDVVEPASNVVARALDAGLLILSAGEYTLRLLPPLSMTRIDLKKGVDMLIDVLQ